MSTPAASTEIMEEIADTNRIRRENYFEPPRKLAALLYEAEQEQQAAVAFIARARRSYKRLKEFMAK